jgi:acyl dehydratase
MTAMHAKVGDFVKFSKTVGESDIYLFAGLTGDLSPNHVDDEFVSHSIYGRRIAHGALMIGFMSTASTRRKARARASIPRRFRLVTTAFAF